MSRYRFSPELERQQVDALVEKVLRKEWRARDAGEASCGPPSSERATNLEERRASRPRELGGLAEREVMRDAEAERSKQSEQGSERMSQVGAPSQVGARKPIRSCKPSQSE